MASVHSLHSQFDAEAKDYFDAHRRRTVELNIEKEMNKNLLVLITYDYNHIHRN